MKTLFFTLTILVCLKNVPVSGITGGEPAKEGEFPFMVSIRDRSNCHVCGGTIIGDRWILTSSRCYSLAWWGKVSFGSTSSADQCTSNSTSLHISIDDILYNPWAWDKPPYTHDLILVHLNESISFGPNVQPVQLPELDEEWPSDKIGTILGWGVGDNLYPSEVQNDLQKARIPLYNDEYCNNSSLWNGWHISDSTVMKCGGEVNKTYYCSGDYGGPLLVDGKQYGIISYIFYTETDGLCGKYLGIFSPVSYFRQWIQDTTGI